MYKQIDSNKRLSVFLIGLFLVFLVGLGWFISWYYKNPMYLYIICVFAIIQAFASYWWSDKISLGLAGAKEVKRSDYLTYFRIVENLSIASGLPKPKLYVIEDEAPNAFATGRDPEHSAIAVTTGLLNMMNKRQLEGVIAHEMAHIGNRDSLVMMICVVLVVVVAVISDWFIRFQWIFGDRNNRQSGSIFAIIGIVGFILAPLIAKLIQLAVSRKREYLADATGSLMTRFPEGLAEALQKIANDKNDLKRYSSSTSHLYIANPIKKKNWMTNLFSTHPPITDRIKKLREMID